MRAIVDGPVSRIEWVEEQLRNALLDGDLAPGERLLTAQLAERFQVSPTPLREALHRIAGEGLVEFIPQRGARVAPLSVADSLELIELRTLLDPACVRRAVEHRSDDWNVDVKKTADDLVDELTTRRYVVRDTEQAYRRFYDALTSTCDSARLHRYASSVRDQHSRYRTATLDTIDRAGLADLLRKTADAAIGGNAKRAAEAVRSEIELFMTAFSALAPECAP